VVKEETARGVVLLAGVFLIATAALYLLARWVIANPGLPVTATIFGILVGAIGAATTLLLKFFSRDRK
jgi:tetrahydromethanopterin S-methyltransferase subunit E